MPCYGDADGSPARGLVSQCKEIGDSGKLSKLGSSTLNVIRFVNEPILSDRIGSDTAKQTRIERRLLNV
jgi:hypothetical protein